MPEIKKRAEENATTQSLRHLTKDHKESDQSQEKNSEWKSINLRTLISTLRKNSSKPIKKAQA